MSLMAVAAIAGVGTAFALAPKASSNAAPVVYAQKGSGTVTFSYTSVKPLPKSCQTFTKNAVCTITTTIPIATLNAAPYNATFPAQGTSPHVTYLNYTPGQLPTLFQ